MHVKISMKAVPRTSLSEHELKRCRAVSRGSAWQVLEEDILWWSLDKQSWLPVEDDYWPNRRRWLMVETEHGVEPAQLWEVRETDLPVEESREDVASSPFAIEARNALD